MWLSRQPGTGGVLSEASLKITSLTLKKNPPSGRHLSAARFPASTTFISAPA